MKPYRKAGFLLCKTLMIIYNEFMDSQRIEGIDNFRFAVEQAMRHPRSHDLEQQTAMLAIEAVTLQLPFIREGLVSDDY